MENDEALTADQLKQAQDSWKIVHGLDESYETQGIVLYRNIFEIAPGAL